MLTPRKVCTQIQRITTALILSGLCEAQNYPSLRKYPGGITEIGITNSDNSAFLKSIPYEEVYREARKKKAYNMKMIDGALITLHYRFYNDDLIAHRLSFFPNPSLEAFQNEPLLYLEDELYVDVLDKRSFPVPFRFDFDNDEKIYKPIEHPISHFTIGQYKNCRIPVSSALTPYQFIKFVTSNFYHAVYLKHDLSSLKDGEIFQDCIFEEEREIVYLSINA